MAVFKQRPGSFLERPPIAAETGSHSAMYRPWQYGQKNLPRVLLAEFAALLAFVTAVSSWHGSATGRAQQLVAQAGQNRAIDGDKAGKDQTDRALQRKSLSMLSPLVDPDKDCRLVKDEETCKIKIEIPGNKLRSLAPEVVSLLDKTKPLHNAPMSLIGVEGDFAARVQVTGEMSPGSTLPKDAQGNERLLSFTFQGAGLILYKDRDNFVRLERTAGVGAESDKIHKVLFEVVKGGKRVDSSYVPVPEGPLCLFIMRRKGRATVGTGPNLATQPIPIKGIELDFPAKVKIGLSASNISAKPFTATFENFALFTDIKSIDTQFGALAR
jgi:hypothetical protein